MNTLTHPKHRACEIVNEYARIKAALEAATANTRAEIINLTAALNAAAKPHEAKLEALEKEAKQLALDHGEAIFGDDKRSLTENGFTLGVRETAAVEVEDEQAAIRMLCKDAASALSEAHELACRACMRVQRDLDREYILRHYDESPVWFHQYGIKVVDKKSASLKPAPKPRTPKAKQIKKLNAAEEPMESEAA